MSTEKDHGPMAPIDVARMLELVDKGGWLVSSSSCSSQEIVWARAERRIFVATDGLGYVVRPLSSRPREPR